MWKGEGQCSEGVLGMVSACILYLVKSFGVFCTVHFVLQGGKRENKLKERGRTVYTVGQFIEQVLDDTMCSAFPKAIKREFSK